MDLLSTNAEKLFSQPCKVGKGREPQRHLVLPKKIFYDPLGAFHEKSFSINDA